METVENLLTGTVTPTPTIPGNMLQIPEDLSEPMDLSTLDDTETDPELPAPAPTTKKPRNEAFADRVAHDRATALLGTDYPDVMDGMSKAPKKVAEKAYNALCYLADRGKLSCFTEMALAHLKASSSLKSADLVALFKGKYTDKTARSQAQQQMTVLPILKLATKAGDTLTLNPGHMLELFDEAATRTPEDKAVNRKPAKSKGPDAETVLADAPEQEPEEAPEVPPAHDTQVVEDLLVGMAEPEPTQVEDLAAEPPAPVSKLSTMSAEAAIEAFAAQQYASDQAESEALDELAGEVQAEVHAEVTAEKASKRAKKKKK